MGFIDDLKAISKELNDTKKAIETSVGSLTKNMTDMTKDMRATIDDVKVKSRQTADNAKSTLGITPSANVPVEETEQASEPDADSPEENITIIGK
ncbi:MAG: hypothetical protein ABI354_01595, partial [Candidatus Saccharimonadales bacterium]